MDTVNCPYCGYANNMTDGLVDLPDSHEFDHECENCGEEFEVLVEFTPTYSANKIVYKKCELCGKVTRDYYTKGKAFPFPKKYNNSLCNVCFFNELAKEWKESC